MRNRPKLPAPKVGKDGCQLFNKNCGYKDPDCITAIMWVTASCNDKDALTLLQMELEGEQLQIWWKPAQKKNSKNQIVIYGLPLGFDQKGIMQELLHGHKECKKDLGDGNQFDPSQNIERHEMQLLVFNGYYKQATAPKVSIHAKGLKNSLNKNHKYMQNGCRVFHMEYNPSENKQMDHVWTQFIESGCSKLVFGLRSMIFVLPAPGQQAPNQITLIRRYIKFNCRYTLAFWIMSHATVTNLKKVVKVMMADLLTPMRKFTTLHHKYMDLCTPEDLEVFHAVVPRVVIATCGPLVGCLYLAGNYMAKNIAAKIAVCPSAWWWHLFQVQGYNTRMAQSLLDWFEMDAAYVMDQLTFDRKTGIVTTQFANADDFFDCMEDKLGLEDKINASIDCSPPAQTPCALLPLGDIHVLYPSGSAHHTGSYYSCPG